RQLAQGHRLGGADERGLEDALGIQGLHVVVRVLGRVAGRHVVTSGTRRIRGADAGRSSGCTLGCDRVSMISSIARAAAGSRRAGGIASKRMAPIVDDAMRSGLRRE